MMMGPTAIQVSGYVLAGIVGAIGAALGAIFDQTALGAALAYTVLFVIAASLGGEG
jgi:hypothetical protein